MPAAPASALPFTPDLYGGWGIYLGMTYPYLAGPVNKIRLQSGRWYFESHGKTLHTPTGKGSLKAVLLVWPYRSTCSVCGLDTCAVTTCDSCGCEFVAAMSAYGDHQIDLGSSWEGLTVIPN